MPPCTMTISQTSPSVTYSLSNPRLPPTAPLLMHCCSEGQPQPRTVLSIKYLRHKKEKTETLFDRVNHGQGFKKQCLRGLPFLGEKCRNYAYFNDFFSFIHISPNTIYLDKMPKLKIIPVFHEHFLDDFTKFPQGPLSLFIFRHLHSQYSLTHSLPYLLTTSWGMH